MAAFVNGPAWGRLVSVRAYLRYRRGRWETVMSHIRTWPCCRQDHSLEFSA